MATLTIVVGYRNREISRARRFLESLRRQTCDDFSLILVDYGSDPGKASAMKSLVDGYSFASYIYSETRGWPWNRAHALNTGIRLADSRYVMTSDIDLIYSNNLIEVILDRASESKALHSLCYYLPRRFDKYDEIDKHISSYRVGGKDALGLLQVLPKEIYVELRGFDEYYRFWGAEDRDLHYRLLQYGVNFEWLDLKSCPIYHQWHPVFNNKTPNFMPVGFWEDVQFYVQKNIDILKRNNENWGKIVKISERPALNLLNQNEGELRTIFLQGPFDICIQRLVKEFKALKTREGVRIQFNDSNTKDVILRIIWLFNKVLSKINLKYYIAPHPPTERNSIIYVIEKMKSEIADYYLELKGQNSFCIVVKL